ncbi:MAG: hypothetical protein ABSH47_22210 [Bryobacteraceae bacterium]
MVLFATGLLPLWAGEGLHPRGDATDYPAHAAGAGITLGARVLRADLVRQLFVTDLNRGGYVVVELAVYPEPGKSADIVPQDFFLSQGSDENGSRAATPQAIAAMLTQSSEAQRRRPIGKDVTLYPTADVGYETGIDPMTGRRVSGTYAGGGMGVGIGGPPAAPPPPPGAVAYERDTMAQELSDKAFPEGTVTEPVAGYLYFPKPSKKAKGPFDLTWYAPSGKVHLSVPQPEKK